MTLADQIHGQTIDVTLFDVPVAYKTWGRLNEDADNALIVCHALTGSADVNDWWEPLVGPGYVIDTRVFFVICMNVPGSPYGTVSPLSINPTTGRRYAADFPSFTIRDTVRLHKVILDRLQVRQVQAVLGGSMGGMQVLEWAFFGKELIRTIIPIATAPRQSAWCIGWSEAQRMCIRADPKYDNGYYKDSGPIDGLAAARMQALLTYRAAKSFDERFGRKACGSNKKGNPNEDPNLFRVQSYLYYQGDKFIKRFDANCYIALTRMMDTHDVARSRGCLNEVLRSIEQPTLIISVNTDVLYQEYEQQQMDALIPNSEWIVLHSDDGHDGFLLEFEVMEKHFRRWFKKHLPGELIELYDKSEKQGKTKVKQTAPSFLGEKDDK